MPPSFAVEKTLGRLGKWLRLMGFDTIAETEFPKGVFRAHIDAGRIFLTRTQRALRIPAPFRMIFIQANDPFEQLAEVVGKAALQPADLRPFSRCLRCNNPIVAVPKDDIERVMPDYVWQTHDSFSRCPKCLRVYWKGSHTARSLEKINSIFKQV
jgi:uncharacterized protein with PIN domain